MMKEMHKPSDVDLLPMWQRIAWMAGIWALSVGAMALISWLIKLWIAD